MKAIELYGGKGVALVDDDDFEMLSKFRWTLHVRGYAQTKLPPDNTTALMHRMIHGLGRGRSVQVDHRDGSKLDNRKSNLRVCNNSQNHANMPKSPKSKRPYKGVHRPSNLGPHSVNPWRASITVRGAVMPLGKFANAEDAARAYNAAAVEHFGEYALLNEIPGDGNVQLGIGADARVSDRAA